MANSVFITFQGGHFQIPGQTTGDLLVATSATTWGVIPDVATGQVLTSGGVGAPPAYSATLPSAVQDNITRTGTLVAGATGAGFTVALTTSTITGTLADARLSSNVPLINAANTFTAAQTINAGAANPLVLTANGADRFIRLTSADSYAGLLLTGGQGGDVAWLTVSGYPSAGNYTIREQGVNDAVVIAKTTHNATVRGTLGWGGGSAITSSSNVLVANGINFGPAAVASITVVNGQITAIS